MSGRGVVEIRRQVAFPVSVVAMADLLPWEWAWDNSATFCRVGTMELECRRVDADIWGRQRRGPYEVRVVAAGLGPDGCVGRVVGSRSLGQFFGNVRDARRAAVELWVRLGRGTVAVEGFMVYRGKGSPRRHGEHGGAQRKTKAGGYMDGQDGEDKREGQGRERAGAAGAAAGSGEGRQGEGSSGTLGVREGGIL